MRPLPLLGIIAAFYNNDPGKGLSEKRNNLIPFDKKQKSCS
jgi:hypothetical protein